MHPFTRETFPASAAVRPFVSDYWMIRWPDGFAEDRVVHLPPDGSIHIVYRVDTADASTCRALRSVLYVKGPSHRANREKATCAPILLGFRLRPGMSQSLLPIAAVELANRVCDLEVLSLTLNDTIPQNQIPPDILKEANDLKEQGKFVYLYGLNDLYQEFKTSTASSR